VQAIEHAAQISIVKEPKVPHQPVHLIPPNPGSVMKQQTLTEPISAKGISIVMGIEHAVHLDGVKVQQVPHHHQHAHLIPPSPGPAMKEPILTEPISAKGISIVQATEHAVHLDGVKEPKVPHQPVHPIPPNPGPATKH